MLVWSGLNTRDQTSTNNKDLSIKGNVNIVCEYHGSFDDDCFQIYGCRLVDYKDLILGHVDGVLNSRFGLPAPGFITGPYETVVE